jgi:hypothetical protein
VCGLVPADAEQLPLGTDVKSITTLAADVDVGFQSINFTFGTLNQINPQNISMFDSRLEHQDRLAPWILSKTKIDVQVTAQVSQIQQVEEQEVPRPVDWMALRPREPGIMESLARDLERRLEEGRAAAPAKPDPYAEHRRREELRAAQVTRAGEGTRTPAPQRLSRFDAQARRRAEADLPSEATEEQRRRARRHVFPGEQSVEAAYRPSSKPSSKPSTAQSVFLNCFQEEQVCAIQTSLSHARQAWIEVNRPLTALSLGRQLGEGLERGLVRAQE